MDVRLPDGTVITNVPEGTRQSDLVARVAKLRAPKVEENPTSLTNLAGAALEPMASLASGMVTQPVAGLAGIAGTMLPGPEGQGADWVHKISGLTYQPRTEGGRNAASAVGYLPEKLGELADVAGGGASDIAGPAVGAAVNTAINVVPAALGMKGPSTLSNAAGSASTGLMRSALKPPVSEVLNGNAGRAIETLLDQGINVTPGGTAKLADRVSSVNDRIVDALTNSTARVNKIDVANRTQDLTKRVERQVNPTADVKAVENAYNEFVDHPLVPGADMPVQLAQELKQGTYRRLRDKYGEMGSADTEAQKALARGLKEEIAAAVPEVGPLNAKESELLNAKKLLDRRVAVAGNHNPLGITHLSPTPTNLIAGMMDRSELIKSLLARGLNPGDLALSDMSAAGATAPQTFSDDTQKKRRVIAALMGAR